MIRPQIIAAVFITVITCAQVHAQDRVTSTAQSSNENVLADLWQESDLSSKEIPSYWYFTNAGEGHHNLNLENAVAVAVKTYAGQNGMEKEEWELKRILYQDGIYHAYVESVAGNELYILLLDREPALYMYHIIAADIRYNDDAETSIHVEGQSGPSYNSILEWNSYLQWFQEGTEEGGLDIVHAIDATYWLYDSSYEDGIYYALYDYLDRTDGKKKSTWTIDSNSVYIGRNGCIADIYCTNGEEGISMLIDVWNKRYTVLK